MCVQVHMEVRRECQIPGPGVIDALELLDVGAGH